MKYFLLILLLSCSGYRLSDRSNPFKQYGIKTLYIPLFYNQSNLANLSGSFTQEVYSLLSEFKELRLLNSPKYADAVLVGVVRSPDSLKDTRRNKSNRTAKNVAPEAIGSNRRNFSIPAVSQLRLNLQIFIIKNPSEAEIKILQSELGSEVAVNSKIIFNQMIPLMENYNREIFDGTLTKINYTQSKGAETRALKSMARNAATSFRDMILYVF